MQCMNVPLCEVHCYKFFASEGADFSLDATEFTFAANSGNDITTDVIVTPTDDVFVEGTESYILSIAMSSGPASIGAMDMITVNIADNEGILYNIRPMT